MMVVLGEKDVKIQNVKIMEGLSDAEAIKRVKWTEQTFTREWK